jgi:hypothetical protein
MMQRKKKANDICCADCELSVLEHWELMDQLHKQHRNISNNLPSGFSILNFFGKMRKKSSSIVWHPLSLSFPTSQKSILSAHICARPRSAHPEFPDPSSKKEERQGSR